jgi:hypothetical protein
VTPVTDAELRQAWTIAVNLHGRAHPIIGRVAEMAQEWRTLPERARERHRRLALALLEEIAN